MMPGHEGGEHGAHRPKHGTEPTTLRDTRAQEDHTNDATTKSPTEMQEGYFTATDPHADGPHDADTAVAVDAPRLPVTLGDYEVLQELGRGGMGLVYRARQRSADRMVALKVIGAECLDHVLAEECHVVERFRTEAKAAAQLDHPNIVTVYEVGESGGQHFFSMQYVEGDSLSGLLADGPLDHRQAARYLEPVARAVHHAHIHGILHRDLKPQNILVDGESDVPLVADFGLAKLLERDQGLTMQGQAVGTPQYMSPEQSRDAARVTTASDVYSLGATLYHLLTGRPPFHTPTLLETLRQIQEEDPVSPRRLNSAIDRDLETICLKCLEKDPARRYGSAALLADELHRYLSGEPVQARRLGPLRRTWRWCRRKPMLAGLWAFAVTSLLATVVGITVGLVRARTAEERERLGYQYARNAVNELFTEVSENTLLNQPGMQPLRETLLKRALAHYERFLELRSDDPRVRDEIAQTHFRIGRIVQDLKSCEAARPYYETALSMQRELVAEDETSVDRSEALGDTLNALGWVYFNRGKIDSARRYYLESARLRDGLAEQFPTDPSYRRKQANTYMNLGWAEQQRGKLGEAQRLMNAAQSIRRDMVVGHGTAQNLRDLAVGYYSLADLAYARGDPKAARDVLHDNAIPTFARLLASSEKVIEDRYRLALCYRLLGDTEGALTSEEDGPQQAALKAFLEARSMFERLVEQNAEVVKYQMQCAAVHNGIALLELRQGRAVQALESFRRAESLLTALVREHPRVMEYSRELAMTLGLLANVRLERGEAQPAQEALDRSIRVLQAMGSEDPRDREALEKAQRLRRALSRAQQ